MRGHAGAGDEHRGAAALGIVDDLLRPLRRAMRRRYLHLVGDAELVEGRAGLRHHLGVGVGAHHDADERCRHVVTLGNVPL